MVTKAQKKAAKKNIKKAQETWQNMSPSERSAAQPEEDERADPGEQGGGDFYRIVVRDSDQFVSFRTHDVGDPGGIERIAGKREDGSWDTQAWLIGKNMARLQDGILETENEDVQDLLDQLSSAPKHVKGDIFQASP